jgi:uncharacterized protein (TIGR02231 family)
MGNNTAGGLVKQRQRRISILFFFVSAILFGEDNMQKMSSRISEVIVYQDRALVTRSAEVQLSKGSHVLRFSDLPQEIVANSIQVDGQGPANLKDVRFTVTYDTQIGDDKIQVLVQKLELARDDLQVLKDQWARLEAELDFVNKIAERVTAGGEKGQAAVLDPDKWIKLTQFYRQRLEALQAEKRSTEIAMRGQDREVDKLEREIASLNAQQHRSNKHIEVEVEMSTAASLTLNVAYVVIGPSWYPHYDLRVNTEAGTMAIAYYARVKQSTGEDWQNTAVKLSTAQVHIGGQQPQLQPWRISTRQVRPFNGTISSEADDKQTMRRGKKMAQMMLMEEASYYAAGEEPVAAMAIPEAAVASKSTSVEFIVAGKNTIISDNQPYQLTIMNTEMASHFQYSTVPKLSAYAYLKARVKNTSGYPLLAGESNVFLDNHFVANAALASVAPGEEFWTFLGVDEGIKVEHKFINKFREDTGIFSKTEKTTLEYLIKITNNKSKAIELLVWDQIPFSSDEDIRIKLINPAYDKDTPQLKMNEDRFLEWYFEMQPQEKIEIPLKFSIESPKEKELIGL